MPNPKRKLSKSKQRKRRTFERIDMPAYSECPNCHQPKLPHRVCWNCGYYKGRQVIEV